MAFSPTVSNIELRGLILLLIPNENLPYVIPTNCANYFFFYIFSIFFFFPIFILFYKRLYRKPMSNILYVGFKVFKLKIKKRKLYLGVFPLKIKFIWGENFLPAQKKKKRNRNRLKTVLNFIYKNKLENSWKVFVWFWFVKSNRLLHNLFLCLTKTPCVLNDFVFNCILDGKTII